MTPLRAVLAALPLAGAAGTAAVVALAAPVLPARADQPATWTCVRPAPDVQQPPPERAAAGQTLVVTVPVVAAVDSTGRTVRLGTAADLASLDGVVVLAPGLAPDVARELVARVCGLAG